MALKFTFILAGTLLTAAFLLPTSAALGGKKGGGLLGGWSPITNTKDRQIISIGKFAVDEYNKETKSKLTFKKVVKGETQVVAGTNYRLVIAAAKDGGYRSGKYLAVVWEKPWENYRNLTSFKKL
ncbi:cysteine proteinase inhibitor 5 [Capsicum chacoense]